MLGISAILTLFKMKDEELDENLTVQVQELRPLLWAVEGPLRPGFLGLFFLNLLIYLMRESHGA